MDRNSSPVEDFSRSRATKRQSQILEIITKSTSPSPQSPTSSFPSVAIMADDAEAIHAAELKKKRQFRKYSYRGIDLEDLLDKSSEEVKSPLNILG